MEELRTAIPNYTWTKSDFVVEGEPSGGKAVKCRIHIYQYDVSLYGVGFSLKGKDDCYVYSEICFDDEFYGDHESSPVAAAVKCLEKLQSIFVAMTNLT